MDTWYLIRQLFDLKSLDKLTQHFKYICNGKVKRNICIIKKRDLVNAKSNAEDYVNKVQDILYDEVFMTYSEDPRLLHIISQFLGEELTALSCMLINKPPGSTKRPPHQDMFYFPVRPDNIIASWTAIDPSTRENGCLYCIPGSHRLGLLQHGSFQDSNKFFHVVLSVDILITAALKLSPGDTIFFHPYLIHGSEANLSQNYRKSMVAHYMNSGCEFVDLLGTAQESVVEDYKYNVEKPGFPDNYEELWKLKSKKVKSVRCHL